jgi:hypothetical protein
MKLSFDRWSVGQCVLVSGSHLELKTRFSFPSDNCGFLDVGHPLWRDDGSAICSVITQWSESLRTRNHTLLSHLRLPQPGGPVTCNFGWHVFDGPHGEHPRNCYHRYAFVTHAKLYILSLNGQQTASDDVHLNGPYREHQSPLRRHNACAAVRQTQRYLYLRPPPFFLFCSHSIGRNHNSIIRAACGVRNVSRICL